MTPFARAIASFISSEGLLAPGQRVVAGLSGGADSVALLAVLRELGVECLAVHCHFGLRGAEADRDLEHSRAVAARLGAEFVSVKFPTRAYMADHGVSAEMACRELRYDFFRRLLRERGFDVVAVGHHREDNVETMLLNLLRGCGIHGVRAMLPRSGDIIRPLLATPKDSLLAYLAHRGLTYVTDSTNLEADVARNRLRLEVMPALLAAFPGAAEMLSRSLENLRGCEALYNSLLPPRGERLAGVSPTLAHEWLAPYGFNSAQCAAMTRAAAGALFESAEWRVTICADGRYELTTRHEAPERPSLKGVIRPRPENFTPRKGVLYLDASAAEGNPDWELRLWQPGDRMTPFGMKGSRMVADVLADSGVSASARRLSWVLTRNGRVLWAVGVRASALFPVTPQTKEIIEITIEKPHHEEI